ncbi:laccase [Ceratobasidium sp. 423]|nr:laccase [Ceratobasidium sp. 423]
MVHVHKAIFTSLLLSGSSLAANVPYNFRIRNVQAAPDGFQRSVVSVNGLIPGTLITANKGDTLLVNVTNELTDASMRRATTIHWHGLFQSTTASEDGPAFGKLSWILTYYLLEAKPD